MRETAVFLDLDTLGISTNPYFEQIYGSPKTLTTLISGIPGTALILLGELVF